MKLLIRSGVRLKTLKDTRGKKDLLEFSVPVSLQIRNGSYVILRLQVKLVKSSGCGGGYLFSHLTKSELQIDSITSNLTLTSKQMVVRLVGGAQL